ncbi:unnamed protein product, partial [marine sediment metagenome]
YYPRFFNGFFCNFSSIFILDHIIRVAYVLIYGGISTFSFNFKFIDIDLQRLDEEEIKLDEKLQKKPLKKRG